MSEIAFTKVKLPFGWLGNMAAFPITYMRNEWRTSEALFQALRFDDYGIRERIRQEKSPMSAKMMAKSLADQMVVQPRSPEDLALMRKVLRLKVDQHPALKSQLLATGGVKIIEDCSRRQNESGLFWGAGKQPDGSWIGANHLGVLWMELRSQLREESLAASSNSGV